MTNMSHCRFENTSRDLDDCKDALEELLTGAAREPLDRRELEACKRLVETCGEILSLIGDHMPPCGDADDIDTIQREADNTISLANEATREARAEEDDEDDDDPETEVCADPFEESHGRPPRGKGDWCFAPSRNAHVGSDPNVFWVRGAEYAEAEEEAVRHFTALEVPVVYVLP